jgi:polar amino acid transport system permease protein
VRSNGANRPAFIDRKGADAYELRLSALLLKAEPMGLEFSGTLARLDLLFAGAVNTIWISAVAMAVSMLIGIACAVVMGTGKTARYVVLAYVEIIRNTPILVQLFLIYFGLPSIGIKLSPLVSAIIGLSIYGGAYVTEIVRAGIDQIPNGQIEAGKALGMKPWPIFSKIVLRPAISYIYPALVGQFVLLLQSSSLLSAISVAELTAAGNDIQSATVRNFEAFIFIAIFYLALTTIVRLALTGIGRVAFPFSYVRR